ncbi:MAG: roadblock/LC7 domain-containing protein [Desulfomonilaceae bacterium]|jgi:predicted regulator of Ras-like GTPase activity (Roadblock/LC7/MglB family)
MADLVLTKQSLDRIDSILASLLARSAAHTVLLVDKAGQLISFQGAMNEEKVASLAALTAANYGATTAIARLFGEEEFSLLFHKGNAENIHFSNVGEECLMVTIFSNNTHLGLVRLEVRKTVAMIEAMFAENLRQWFNT